jgi:hypothetical protein
MARLAYGVLMPFMQADLNMNYTQAGLLATTISLCLLAISPLAGLLAIKKMITGEIPESPAAQVLGFKVVDVEEGKLLLKWKLLKDCII